MSKCYTIESYQLKDQSNLTKIDEAWVVPDWFTDAVLDGRIRAESDGVVVITPDGPRKAYIDDVIIRGSQGDMAVYPVKHEEGSSE